MTVEAELLRRYVENHSEADFAELVRRNIGLVYHAALRRTGGRADLAQDISQQVFTILAQKAKSLLGHESLAGWLYTTTRFATNRLLRTEQRRAKREMESVLMSELICPPLDEEWTKMRWQLDSILDELPERDRDVVLQRFFHSHPYSEIAAKSGMSEEAARKRVDRALDRLRLRLLKRGVISTAGALVSLLSAEAALNPPPGLIESVTASALAPTAAGLTSASAIHLMSTTKVTLGLAGALGIAALLSIPAIGIATYQLREAHRAKVALTLAQQHNETERERLKQLEESARAADQRVAEAQKSFDATQALVGTKNAGGRAVATNGKPDKQADPLAEGVRFLSTFGEARPLLTEVGKAQIHRNLAAFYRQAHLTQAQIDQLETQTAAYWLANIAVSPNSIHPAKGQLPDDELRAIIGDDGVNEMRDYNRKVSAVMAATELATHAAYRAPAMSAAQVDQITQAIMAHSDSYQSGKNLQLGDVDWNAVTSDLRTLLPAGQMQAAEGTLVQLQYQSALRQAQRANAAGTANVAEK